jgi:CheY-like chemotaxis protein
MAGEKSYMNDVKFVGGHGTLRKPVREPATVSPVAQSSGEPPTVSAVAALQGQGILAQGNALGSESTQEISRPVGARQRDGENLALTGRLSNGGNSESQGVALGYNAPPLQGDSPAITSAPPLTNCNILYVEDTKVNQIVLSKQLEKAGATVALADNGQIGIDKIAEATVQGKPFDIILMDMQMPVLDGYEATKQLRANSYKKPIIAVTAHALPGDREKTLEAGCDEYVAKPVDFARLIELITMFWK